MISGMLGCWVVGLLGWVVGLTFGCFFGFVGLLGCWVVGLSGCWVAVFGLLCCSWLVGLLFCEDSGLLWVLGLLDCWVVGLLGCFNPIKMARRNARSD